MAQKFCGEVVRLKKNYMSEVGGWVEDERWGDTEYVVARRRLIRRNVTGLAIKTSGSDKLDVLIEGQLWPIPRNALALVQ
jgi:hypothetical protein